MTESDIRSLIMKEIYVKFESQKKLAELLGMSESAFSKGLKRMSKKLLAKIEDAGINVSGINKGNFEGNIKVSKSSHSQNGIIKNNINIPPDYEKIKAENELLKKQIEAQNEIIILLKEKIGGLSKE